MGLAFVKFAGRPKLLHIVITHIVLYWVLIHQLPEQTIAKINTLCSSFFGQVEDIRSHGIDFVNLKEKGIYASKELMN